MYKNKRNGFTLVELMAVIIIISLIALLTFPNIINQIKKTKKSNNKMIEDVVIEQAKKYIHDNDSEYIEDDEYCIPLTKLIDNGYIKEDLTSINDIKDNKAVQVISGDNNSYQVVDKDKCVPTAVKYLLKRTNPKTITNYTDGDIHEMYTFDHEATVQTPALTDYRYIGSDPYNYVEFNDELWRIIGVFETDDGSGRYEQRIKIVRSEKLNNNMVWDSSSNEWSTASLNLFLNNDYYNELNSVSKEMIVDTKYYLGGNSTYVNLSGKDYYNFERGKVLFNSSRSLFWSGKIALMYPSDYSYTYALGVDNTCYSNGRYCYSGGGGMPNKGWIYTPNSNILKWLLSPCSGYSNCSFYVEPTGSVYGYNGVYNPYGVRPTMYLSSTVKIISGDGTKDNAYKLSM